MELSIGDKVFIAATPDPYGTVGVIEELDARFHRNGIEARLYLIRMEDGRRAWFDESELQKLHA